MLAANQAIELPVPDGHTTMLVVQDGSVTVNGTDQVAVGALALFDRTGDSIALASATDARALLLSGEPIGEPVVGQGPFVMSSSAEIRQAIVDYQSGQMGSLN
jgi:redox-sensitive bicupin YhaK (pirin superfamily)